MIFHRLIAWLRRPKAAPPTPTSLSEPLIWRDAAADLDEFGRLLCSGKPEDLKKIAQAMTRSDEVRP